MNAHSMSEAALDPLERLIRARFDRLEYCAYCPSQLTRAHPTLNESLCEPLSQSVLGLDEALIRLQRGDRSGFHPHDPVLRATPEARRRELIRRLIRAHEVRLKSAAHQTGVPVHELRHLAWVSLSPRVPTALWSELVYMEIKKRLTERQLSSPELLSEIHKRLLEPDPHQRWHEAWAHQQLTNAMRRLHRVLISNRGELFERYLQSAPTFDLPLFEDPMALYQRASQSVEHLEAYAGVALVNRCLNAYYRLADRQRHELPLLVIAQHRKRLLEEISSELKRRSQGDEVIRRLFGEGELAGELRRQATLDPSLFDELNRLAEQPRDGSSMLDWIGRMDALELGGGEHVMEAERTEGTVERVAEPQLELSGVGLGDELARLLPSELALLANQVPVWEAPDERVERSQASPEGELELLFFQRFTEKRLCLYQPDERERALTPQPEVQLERVQVRQGPYVLCIDSSYSMSGERERLAKALAFQLTARAYEEGRSCHIITFSIDTLSVDLTALPHIGALVRFLASSFGGGTDLSPALEEAHQLLREQSGDYQGADILVVSDFQLPPLSHELSAEQKANQAQGVRYAGVLVGAQHSAHEFFKSCSGQYTLCQSGLAALAPVS